MKTLLATGAALGLVMAVAPASAQYSSAQSPMATTASDLSASQQTAYDGWPADRRATYDAWPAEAQRYFWTLNPDQMRGWWVLNDQQRVQIVEMVPEQRAAAWTSILNQMTGGSPMAAPAGSTAMAPPASAPATTARATTSSGNIDFRRSERVQAPPSNYQPTAGGEVPVCSRDRQDSCINPWEAGQRGPGVNRPLDHWPGRPASER